YGLLTKIDLLGQRCFGIVHHGTTQNKVIAKSSFKMQSQEALSLGIEGKLVFQRYINSLATLFHLFIDDGNLSQHIIYSIIRTFRKLYTIGGHFNRTLRNINGAKRDTLTL